jgi:multidrug efflux system membrane fusion protein
MLSTAVGVGTKTAMPPYRESMAQFHQNRRRQGGRLALMLTTLLAVLAAVWWFGWHLDAATPQAQAALETPAGRHGPPPVPVYATKAKAANVPIIIRGIGTVAAYNTVTVSSQVTGTIVKIAYRQGQFVQKGQLLVQIDPRSFQAQLEQAEANEAKDAANLANAQRDLTRDAALLPNHLAVTQQQYDTQKALVAQDAATVKADQAQIDTARLNLAYASITSPIDGVTGLRLLDIGNLVEASSATPLVTVTQIKPIYVTFTIPENDLDQVRQAMAHHPLAVQVFNGTDNKQLSNGTLEVINNTVNQNTGTIELEAQFANADAALWPGQFVNAHLVLKTVKNGIVVPLAAVQTGPTGRFVYVIEQNARVEPRPVTVLQTQNGTALLGKGLKSGEEVVTSGQFKLAPGAAVAAQPMPPSGSGALGLEGVGSGTDAIFSGPGF